MSKINALARKSVSYLMLFLAGLIGGGGLLIFMLFLFSGSFNLVELGLSENQALLFDIFLCLLFFGQHSIMARKPVRLWLARYLPTQYIGAVYAIASGVAVLVLVVLWQESSYVLASPRSFVRLILRAVFVLAIAGVGWTIWALGFFVNFRLQSLMDDLRVKRSEPTPVVQRGPYRWVRHPLYLSSLLMIWSFPDLTLDRLMFDLVFTAWVILAILLEERELVVAYGVSYRSYHSYVPMLIPWRIRLGSIRGQIKSWLEE